MNPEKLLEEFLASRGVSTLKIEKMEGSSGADVFLHRKRIFKVGSEAEFNQEKQCYQKFKTLPKYNLIFPWLKSQQSTVDDLMIWEVEYVGETTLEDELLNFRNKQGEAGALASLNRNILDKISLLFSATRKLSAKSASERANLFWRQLLETLETNLKKAELDGAEEMSIVSNIARNQDLFTNNFIPSAAHNDLSTGNIVINKAEQAVKFIDPRPAVPYLQATMTIGNPVVDLTGYYVSVLRKELELKKINPDLSLDFLLTEIIKQTMTKYRSAFSPLLKTLCIVIWYSVYAACRCDYCLSQERLWLYEKMRSELKQMLQEFNKVIAG